MENRQKNSETLDTYIHMLQVQPQKQHSGTKKFLHLEHINIRVTYNILTIVKGEIEIYCKYKTEVQ